MKSATMVILAVVAGLAAILVVAVLVLGSWVMGTYNSMVTLEQGVKAQLSQVDNVYQRRADLIPNLVSTVRGYASHERETFRLVTEARAKVGQVNLSVKTEGGQLNPETISQYMQAQDALSSALSRLMVVMEKYPDLKASELFQNLMVQLEGTENRIAVERKNYNEVALGYNTLLKRFPGNLVAGYFGFREVPYFQAEPGANKAPKVKF